MLKEILKTLWHSWLGKIGIGLLLLLGIGSFYSLIAFPRDYGTKVWNNPVHWADNSGSVPPSWVSLFGKGGFEHQQLKSSNPQVIDKENGKTHLYQFSVKDFPPYLPEFVSFSVSDALFHNNPPIIELYFIRPDGQEVLIYRHIVPGARKEEQLPLLRYHDSPFRTQLTSDQQINAEIESFLSSLRQSGEKRFLAQVNVRLADDSDDIGNIRLVFGGERFGLLGTDQLGRDIFQGILFGLPYAMLIGFGVAIPVTIIGALYGTTAAFVGGKRDLLLQFIVNVVIGIPLLPILIFLVFVAGPSIWYVIFFLVVFGWPSLVLRLRPWVYQIKASGFVEFARARGFSSWRIILRHIIPQTAPFLVANVIFFAASAILTESGLSLLGLGDPSIPTWGQMLHQSYNTGGIYLNHWWEVVPPGVAIMITAAALFFPGYALERFLVPGLKKK